MGASRTYYIELPSDLAKQIRDLGGLSAAIKRVGIENRETQAPFTLRTAEGEKGLETVIIALGGAAPLVAAAISKIVNTLSQRSKVITEETLVPVVTADGKQVYARDGRPVFQVKKDTKIVEPSPRPTSSEIELEVPGLIRVTYKGE